MVFMADIYFILLFVSGTTLISLHRLFHFLFLTIPWIMYYYNSHSIDEKLIQGAKITYRRPCTTKRQSQNLNPGRLVYASNSILAIPILFIYLLIVLWKIGPKLTSMPVFLYFICGSSPQCGWQVVQVHTWDPNPQTWATKAEHTELNYHSMGLVQ